MSVNHELRVAGNIEKLHGNEAYNDVTIILNNGKIKANKVILCASSTYFARALNHKSVRVRVIDDGGAEAEEENGSLVRLDSSKETMGLVLGYMYSGKMKFSGMSFREIFDLTCLLKILEMKLILDFIMSTVMEDFVKMKMSVNHEVELIENIAKIGGNESDWLV